METSITISSEIWLIFKYHTGILYKRGI